MRERDNPKYRTDSPGVKSDGDPAASAERPPAPNSAVDPTDATTTSDARSLRVFVSEFSRVFEFLGVFKTQSLQDSDHSPVDSVALLLAQEFGRLINTNELPRYQLYFRLAKRLRGEPGAADVDVATLRPLVDAFAAAISPLIQHNVPADESWAEFRRYWREIHTPDGANPLRIAFSRVRENQDSPCLVPDDADLQLLARLADELAQERQVFLLQQTEIGELLGKSQRHISNLVAELVSRGIVQRVHRSTGKGDAHKYVAGPALLALRQQPVQLTLVVNKPPDSIAVHEGKKYDRLGKK